MGRALNVITVICIVISLLTACMLDSPSMMPAVLCGASTVIAATCCMIREKLC